MSDRNPPAFPVLMRGEKGLELTNEGQTLADHFAGLALVGLLAAVDGPMRSDCPRESYSLALKMLAERERRGIK